MIVFADTETTALRHDRRAWEVALIIRTPGARDQEFSWFIRADDLNLGNADLMSLKVGRFHERHPDMALAGRASHAERDVLTEVERLTRGAHIVGAVPNFDTEVLGNRMRAHGICPSWHYHLVDIETLAVGYLAASAKAAPGFPWKSDDLSRAVGVEPPGESERHTALGDARWCRAIWDAIYTAQVPA